MVIRFLGGLGDALIHIWDGGEDLEGFVDVVDTHISDEGTTRSLEAVCFLTQGRGTRKGYQDDHLGHSD